MAKANNSQYTNLVGGFSSLADGVRNVVGEMFGGVRQAADSAAPGINRVSAGLNVLSPTAAASSQRIASLSSAVSSLSAAMSRATPTVIATTGAVGGYTSAVTTAGRSTVKLSGEVGTLAAAAAFAAVAVAGLVKSLGMLVGGGKGGGLATVGSGGELAKQMAQMMGGPQKPTVRILGVTTDKPAAAGAATGATAGGAVSGGGGFGQIAGGAAVVANAVMQIGQQVLAMAQRISASVRSYVDAFRPDAVKRLDRAVRDFVAVIGRALVPVTELVTRVMRDLGGVLKTVVVAIQPVIKELATFVGDVLKDFAVLLMELVLLFGDLLPLMKEVIPLFTTAVRAMVSALRMAVTGVRQMVDALRILLGVSRGIQPQSSVGEAARGAQFSSAEEAWKKVMQETASLGRGAAVDPQKQTASATTRIAQWLDMNSTIILGGFSGLAKLSANTPGAVNSVAAAGVGVPNDVATAIKDMARAMNIRI